MNAKYLGRKSICRGAVICIRVEEVRKGLNTSTFKKSHDCICNRDYNGGDDSDTEKLTLLKHFLLRNKNKIS